MSGFGPGPAPRTGRLEELPIARLLHLLLVEGLSGVLRLELGPGPAEIYLVEGQASAVELPSDVDRLGQVLAASGIIDEERVKRALQAPRANGLRYGRMLVDGGLITEAQLRAALRLQIRRRMHRLFFSPVGRYVIDDQPHDRGVEGMEAVRVHPWRAIWQGVRSAWDEARSGSIVGSGRFRLRLAPELVDAYGFGDAEKPLLQELRSRPLSAAELQAAVPSVPPATVRAFLYTLLATDGVRLEAAGVAAPQHSMPRISVPMPLREEFTLSNRLPAGFAPTATPPREPTSTSPTPSAVPSLAPSPARTMGGGPITPPPARPTGSTARSSTIPPTPARPTGGPLPVAAAASAPTPSTPADRRAESNIDFVTARPSGVDRLDRTGSSISPDALARVIQQKAATVEKEDHFQVLGVSRECDKAELKAAWLAGAKLFHPDRLSSLGLMSLRPEAERVFRRVSEAYGTLSDDQRRATYVARLSKPPEVERAEVDAQRVVAAEMAFMEGEVAFKRRDYTTAIEKLTQAVGLNPTDGESLALLAWARMTAQQATLEEITPILERSVQMSPRCARAHFYLGQAMKASGDFARAMQLFKKASLIDPRLVEAQSEVRVLEARARDRTDPGKRGLFDRLLKK